MSQETIIDGGPKVDEGVRDIKGGGAIIPKTIGGGTLGDKAI